MEKTQKKISIIVPFYNAEVTLRDCVRSITEQTYTNLEILLMNDGSTDASFDIATELSYKDSRIRLINLEHGGVSAARNAGLSNMTGDYFCFVDADDSLDLSFCEMMLSVSLQNDADMTFCKIHWIPLDRAIDETGLEAVIASRSWYKFLAGVTDCQFGCVWRILYKSQAFQSNKFNEKIYIYEDLLYLLDCLMVSRNVALCDEKLYHYMVPKEFFNKYYREDFVETCLYIGDCLEERLMRLGAEDYAKAELLAAYCRALSGSALKRADAKSNIKKLKNKEVVARYNNKETIAAYKKLYRSASRIKIFLIKYKMLKTYRFLVKLKYKERG